MTFNRRHFLKGLGILSLAPNTSLTAQPKPTMNNPAFQLAAPPYLQNLTSDAVTVGAIFNKPCFAWLELLNQSGQPIATKYQVEDGMRRANSTNYLFVVDIPEDRTLRYRVVAKEIEKFEAYDIQYGKTVISDIIEAKLAKEDQAEIHCLILNDIHERKESYAEMIAKSTLAHKDLIFLNGDSFHYVTTSNDLTEKLFSPLGEVLGGRTPFVMVRGNHETRGAFARDIKPYFDYPGGNFYHSFKFGPVYWIVLDSGEDKPDDHEVYGGTVDYDTHRLNQRTWLEDVLQSAERRAATHTIVVAHIPFHHSDDWHGTQHSHKCFHDVLQANKVDAVISGHTHRYAFHPPGPNHNYHVIIGGGPKVGQRTFVDIHATRSTLQIQLNHENGEVLGRLDKA